MKGVKAHERNINLEMRECKGRLRRISPYRQAERGTSVVIEAGAPDCVTQEIASVCPSMATLGEIVDAVDAFMATPKRIVAYDSRPTWAPGFSVHEKVAKYPLEVEGELRGSQLMVVSFPYQRHLKFRLGILFPAMVCRLDFTDETHPNSLEGVARGLPPVVQGPHYHSWPLNRRFFRGVTKPPKLHDASPYEESGRTFDAILRWFCTDTNIDQLPPSHLIELLPPELLL